MTPENPGQGLAQQGEWLKLSRLLGKEPAELPFLQTLPETELRRLRIAASEWLFGQHQAVFRRLAQIAVWLPNWLAVPLCQRLGPLLTARIVGHMPARRAAAIASRVPTPYLARICQHLDPRRARDLILLIPHPLIVAVANEMLRQKDYVTMGRFVDYLSDEAIRAVLDAEPDEAELLRIALFIDSKNRLDHVVRLLPEERRRRAMLLALDDRQDLLDEILSLVFHVNHMLKRELGDLAAAQDTAVLDRIIERVQQRQLWGEMLPVVASLSALSQRKVVNLNTLRHNPAVIPAILQAADEYQLWRILLPLAEMLDEPMRDEFARAGALLPTEAIQRAAEAVLVGELWEPMLDLLRRMPAQRQNDFVGVLRNFMGVDSELDRRVIASAHAHGLTAALQSAGIA